MKGTFEGHGLEAFFKGRSRSLDLFRHIEYYMRSLGPVDIEVQRTQVSFGNRSKFAWVWLPQNLTRGRGPDIIALTFALDHRVSDPRIEEAVEPYPGRWTHHVIIGREEDLDDRVKGWLHEAYRFGLTRKGRSTLEG